MPDLFDPYAIGDITFPNRLMIAPMSTYMAPPNGMATDWHFAHYGRFALGGAGMVMVEAVPVAATGRHCYCDLGIWSDEHIAPFARIAEFMKSQGVVPAIQLQHCGRKGGTRRPWDGIISLDQEDAELRGEAPFETIAPSPISYAPTVNAPREMNADDMTQVTRDFVQATERALKAGFEVLEIHMAHGYLLHQFLSPISNLRKDAYGGDRTGRSRFPLEVTAAVRAAWPKGKPLFVRISAVDGLEGGWTIEDSIALSREMKQLGVDVIDCSSGGIDGSASVPRVPRAPGFQIGFAERIRREAEIPTVAVGLITQPQQAAEIIASGKADLVAIGREALINPNWPNVARLELNPEGGYAHWPNQVGWWLDKRGQSIRAKN